MRSIEESISLDYTLWLSIICSLIWSQFGFSNEIIPKGMGQISKLLPVDAYIKHIEGILVIEMRNIWYFAADNFILVYALSTYPIRVVINFILTLLLVFL